MPPVRLTIENGTTIDALATGNIGFELVDGTSVMLSDVLYNPEVERSLISVSKMAEKDVSAQFSKDMCVYRYNDATVMEAKRGGNVYTLKTVGTRCVMPRQIARSRGLCETGNFPKFFCEKTRFYRGKSKQKYQITETADLNFLLKNLYRRLRKEDLFLPAFLRHHVSVSSRHPANWDVWSLRG
ncbi:hypothetical protein PI124_g17614 [Phytophthora idaei]|nr:hypothetical protein PI125_g15174 [Phytophthora idaei]KAG3137984.1 hypothetical protein PI126_g17120 [Phytophthora idaei]KAG3237397.1 hypothetical protein PI124_g17614 [Phytophthora idaei]